VSFKNQSLMREDAHKRAWGGNPYLGTKRLRPEPGCRRARGGWKRNVHVPPEKADSA